MGMGIITLTDAATQVSIKFWKKEESKKKQINKSKNLCISTEHNTSNTYENGDECVWIWKRREVRIHVYTHIRRNSNNKHTNRKGGQTYEQGHAHNKITVPKKMYWIRRKRRKRTKGGYEYRSKHKPRSVCNTGREEIIHTWHRLIETGKQTRNVLGGDRGYYW